MGIIFSAIIIILLSNKSFSDRIVVEEKRNKSLMALFIHFTVFLAIALVLGSIIKYYISNLFLFPTKLSCILVLIMLAFSIGFCFITEYLLTKLNRQSLILFNRNELSILLFIGLMLITHLMNAFLGSLLLTLLNILVFFISGVILITLSDKVSFNSKSNENISIILIVGSILLMVMSAI